MDNTKEKRPKPVADGLRETGQVKWFDPGLGYGFIQRNGKADIFVHKSGIAAGVELEKGQQVDFAVGYSKKKDKPIAEDVKVVEV